MPAWCAASSALAISIPWVRACLIGSGTFFETSLECVAVKVFHYEEIYAVLCADIVEVANMRMVQRGDGPDFALEALTRAGLEDLDGDGAVETGVAAFVDFPHASSANRREDLIGPQFVTSSEGHS